MVYVDGLKRCSTSRKWRWRYSCHLFADEEEELHQFAAKLGLDPTWVQKKRRRHYDLTASKRKLALKLGAMDIPSIRELKGR